MKSNYNQLGQYIEMVSRTNSDLKYGIEDVRGCSNTKQMMQTRANLIGRTYEKFIVLRPQEFVFNRRTTRNGEKIGMAYNNTEREYIFTNDYVAFRVKQEYLDKLLPDYLYMFFCRDEFDRYARYKSTGSATEFFNWEDMCAVPFEIPPMDFQQLVVNAYKVLNERIETKQKINDNLANTEQAILVETVINNHTVPTALGDLVDFIDGDRGKNYPTFDEFTSTGYCLFLNASNVTSTGFNFDNCMFVSEEKDKLMNKGHLSPYDIVLTSRGTLGNVALYDKHIKYENVRINSGMLIIRPKTKRLSPYFIYALLKSSYMKAAIERFKSGSAQPQLPIKDLQKITFEIPESDTVLVALDRQFLAVEESISINNNEIGNLKELSNVLLAELSR